jgi:hypothetical protein
MQAARIQCFSATESATVAIIRKSFIKDVSDILEIVQSSKLDSQKTEKLTEILASVHMHIILCFADLAHWNQRSGRFEGAPDWKVLAEALQRLRDGVSEHEHFVNRMSSLDTAEMFVACPVLGPQNMGVDVIPHRQSAANVLVQLASVYEVAADTLVHALVLLDRYIAAKLSAMTVESLTGEAAACFMISVKLREVAHPLIEDICQIIGIGCQQLRHSEAIVLQSLDWDIRAVSGDFRFIRFECRNDSP